MKVVLTLLILPLLLAAPPLRADTLTDVMRSQTMQRVNLSAEKMKHRRNVKADERMSWFNGMDPKSNFALLWGDSRGATQIFNWMGANIVKRKLLNSLAKRYPENVIAKGTITGQLKIPVQLTVMVPHPTYRTMVDLRTLSEFNQYEPPTLDVVASEEINFNGHKATYYRAVRGGCSLLFKIAQLSIVNLSVKKCENSEEMMEVARALDLNRLNQKLNS